MHMHDAVGSWERGLEQFPQQCPPDGSPEDEMCELWVHRRFRDSRESSY